MTFPTQSDPQTQQITVGKLGEMFVAHWLQLQGWTLVAQGWHCRWGELDIIAQQCLQASEPIQQQADSRFTLAFVEVKTRSQGNWDADGLLAITPQKQAKLWKTAQVFLTQNPQLTGLSCRFDVALVKYRRSPQTSQTFSPQSSRILSGDRTPPAIRFPASILPGQPVSVAGYQLKLETYLEAAFSH